MATMIIAKPYTAQGNNPNAAQQIETYINLANLANAKREQKIQAWRDSTSPNSNIEYDRIYVLIALGANMPTRRVYTKMKTKSPV